ncbi:MAG: class I SAM-dependent methyltransferase [Thermoleophilaceae bacterium]
MARRVLELQSRIDRAAAAILGRIPLERTRRLAKRCSELGYWRSRLAAEGGLLGFHYERFFTEHFGLSAADYSGKRILDIGCGPRGTLDWADAATERVGLDPLADSYRKLTGGRQRMTYVRGRAESIPFRDGRFDVVASFNSLDHVDDLAAAVSEITRVTAAGGTLLLLTDVGHEPTLSEPQQFSWDVLGRFADGWELVREHRFEKVHAGMMESLDAGVRWDETNPAPRAGILSARLRRVS